MREHLEHGVVPNCINLASGTGAATVTVRHLNRTGVIASICEILGRGDLNIEDMENVIFTGGEAASVRIRISAVPEADLVSEIESRPNILSIDVTTH